MLEEIRQANPIRKTELRKTIKEARLQATRVVIKTQGKYALRKAATDADVRRQTNGAQIMACFSSIEELRTDIASRGRDQFVAEIAKNHGFIHDTSRKRFKDDNDGIIYAMIYLDNLNVYVGQTKKSTFV